MKHLSHLRGCQEPVAEGSRALVEAFVSSSGAGRRYVMGRNEHAAALMESIDVDGIIDDFAEPGAQWNGKPVMNATEVPARGIAVNCSMSISPVSAARRLAQLKISGSFAMADLCRVFPDRFPWPEFVRQTREDLEQNSAQWERLTETLADAESRQVLEDVLRFRATGDPLAMARYSVRLRDQYFEDFLHLGPGEVFVDAGGFDGDTTEEFCRHCPAYGKVHFFEPSARNLQKARARLKDMRDIHYHEVGLSDAPGVLAFNPDAGSASAVIAAGVCQIPVITLDQQVAEPVTFIKMDLEGWELKALDGSRRHITETHPKLAIAVYHHPADFWRICEFALRLFRGYQVYLRHYTEGWSETVMYFNGG